MSDTVEEVIYTVLSGSTAVTGLVSTRIYPAILPEDVVYPAVVFARTASEPYSAIAEDLPIGKANINVVALSTNIATAGQIARAVRTVLCVVGATYGNVQIKQIDLESGPRSEYEPTLEVHMSILDFSVIYEDV